MEKSKCKMFELTGIGYTDNRVKRKVAAADKAKAIAAAKRSRIMRTILMIKETKDESESI